MVWSVSQGRKLLLNNSDAASTKTILLHIKETLWLKRCVAGTIFVNIIACVKEQSNVDRIYIPGTIKCSKQTKNYAYL